MKKLLIATAILVAVAGCERDSDTISIGRISFTFSDSKVASGGRATGDNLPAFVLLSIETSTGTAVETDKKIDLIAFGNSYVSQNIELTIGNFKLTKFIILNSDNKAIFATPVAGSSLASLVSKPLPIEFSISADGTTQVIPEVLTITQDNTTSMFGYVEFGFNIIAKSNPKRIKTIVEHYYYGALDEIISKREYFYESAKSACLARMEYSNYNKDISSFLVIVTDSLSYDGNNVSSVVKTHHGTNRYEKYEFLNYVNPGFSIPCPSKVSIASFSNGVQYRSDENLYTFTKQGDNILVEMSTLSASKNFELTVGLDRNVHKMKGYVNNELEYEIVIGYDSSPNPPFYFRDLHWDQYIFLNMNANNLVTSNTKFYNGNSELNWMITYQYDVQLFPTKSVAIDNQGHKRIVDYEYESF
jgi:hypothetical protein